MITNYHSHKKFGIIPCMGALKEKLKFVYNDPIWRTAFLIFVILRILLSVWMWSVGTLIPVSQHPDFENLPYMGVPVEQNDWLEVWQRWDTLQYQAIAEGGYDAFENSLFVPPLYPGLMRLGGNLLGGNTLLAGIIIANIFYFATLVALGKLTLNLYKDKEIAKRAMVYLAVFPTAFFLMAAYTESIFLLGAIMAIYTARKKKWFQAGLWGALAAMVRLPGALIILPIGYTAWEVWKRTKDIKPFWSVVITAGGAGIFPMYVWLWLKLPPWEPLLVQSARFRGGLAFPGWNIIMAAWNALQGIYTRANLTELIFTLLFLVGFIPVWRKMPRIFGVYYASLMGLYLVRIGGTYPLLAMNRYVLVLFPIFILMGKWGQKPWVNRLITYTSWIGLLFMSAQFAVWGWVG